MYTRANGIFLAREQKPDSHNSEQKPGNKMMNHVCSQCSIVIMHISINYSGMVSILFKVCSRSEDFALGITVSSLSCSHMSDKAFHYELSNSFVYLKLIWVFLDLTPENVHWNNIHLF